MRTDRAGYCRNLSPRSKICVLIANSHPTASSDCQSQAGVAHSHNRRITKQFCINLPCLEILVNKNYKKNRDRQPVNSWGKYAKTAIRAKKKASLSAAPKRDATGVQYSQTWYYWSLASNAASITSSLPFLRTSPSSGGACCAPGSPPGAAPSPGAPPAAACFFAASS